MDDCERVAHAEGGSGGDLLIAALELLAKDHFLEITELSFTVRAQIGALILHDIYFERLVFSVYSRDCYRIIFVDMRRTKQRWS